MKSALGLVPPGVRSVLALWLAVLALFLAGSAVYKDFFTLSHAGNIFRSASFIGMAAIGQTLVVLTGGIDLSVGALISLGNVFACLMIDGRDENNLWAISAILLIGALLGAVNGVGVAILKISPMVMTMAIGTIATGITFIYSQGAPKGKASPLLRAIGEGRLSGIPNSVLVWAALSLAVAALLKLSLPGRGIYYVGANETAAVFSGIRANGVKIAAYVVSGAASALTGIIIAGYTVVSYINTGKDYTLSSIAAVIIGGTAMTGGKGGYGGTVAGAVILCLVESLLTIMRMHEGGKRIMNALVILALMAFYYRKEMRARR